MKKITFTMAVFCLFGAMANATSIVGANGSASGSPSGYGNFFVTFAVGPGGSVSSLFIRGRLMADAKPAAAEFLATAGEVTSAKLIEAFEWMRMDNPNTEFNDIQLAQIILSTNI